MFPRSHSDEFLIRPISARYMHQRDRAIMKKKLPKFKTDAEAEAFVDKADLSQYDLSGMKPVSFEFQPKAREHHHAPA